jgi:hypothetical protein
MKLEVELHDAPKGSAHQRICKGLAMLFSGLAETSGPCLVPQPAQTLAVDQQVPEPTASIPAPATGSAPPKREFLPVCRPAQAVSGQEQPTLGMAAESKSKTTGP